MQPLTRASRIMANLNFFKRHCFDVSTQRWQHLDTSIGDNIARYFCVGIKFLGFLVSPIQFVSAIQETPLHYIHTVVRVYLHRPT